MSDQSAAGRKRTAPLTRCKVLELNEQLGEDDGHFVHELLHEFVHLGFRDTRLPQAEVEGVFQEFLVIRTNIDADGDRRVRSNTANILSRCWSLPDGREGYIPSASNIER